MDALEAKVSVSFVPGVTASVAAAIGEAGISPADFLEADTASLQTVPGLERLRFNRSARDEAMVRGRLEVQFMRKHGIHGIYLEDDDYPFLLRETPDAPVLLYCLGDRTLVSEHCLAFVGTRRCTQYGTAWCAAAIADLCGYFPDLTVVSGLAYGIDAASHEAALDCGARTVAVVAHGLDMIYPSGNRSLARRIVRSGGSIVSEYPSATTPFGRRFLERNRIVAGLCEMTVVVESPVKGGAMSTANTAFGYGREVGALPGRAGDEASGGCNLLIRKNKASLVTAAADIIEQLGWKPLGIHLEPRQRNLFPELVGDGAKIYEALRFRAEPQSVDSLHLITSLPVPTLVSALTELEFDGIITRLAGNRYSLA